jgi:tetratricopeptide (TPR) repeat protein
VLAFLFLALITSLAYLPMLRAGFIWDDDTFLTDNTLIKAADGLRRFWFTTQAPDYWPATSSTLWLEWRLWGMNATGYHVTNVLLHVAECCLLWRILVRLEIPGAFFAALLFAVHPVNVESVAWIAQRKNLVAMLFYLVSIDCFIKGGRWHGLSLAAFVLGMLSKGSVAMLPLILLGLVAWKRRPTAGDVARLAPFFAVAVIFTAIDIWFQRHGSGEVIRNAGISERILGAGAVIWFYLYKALWPLTLIFVYPQWHVTASDWLWWLPLLFALLTTGILLRAAILAGWGKPEASFGGLRALAAAWFYFCVMLVPVMGLTDVYFMKYSLVADHYQHLALIGVVAFAAAMGSHLGGRLWAPLAIGCSVFLASLTYRQCLNYRDSETLFRATIAQNPDCWMAHGNLGMSLAASGFEDAGVVEYQTALKINPDYPEAHNNLGIAFQHKGLIDQAIEEYGTAIRGNPSRAEFHSDLSFALNTKGRAKEAIAEAQEALRINKDYPDAENNLGNALSADGRFQEAIASYDQALRLRPGFAQAENGRGVALARMNRLPEATACFEKAISMSPTYAEAHRNLALLLQLLGKGPEAEAQFEIVKRLEGAQH